MSDAPTGPDVLYEVEGSVATLTLNRPHRRNAITKDFAEGVQSFLDKRDPTFQGR